MGYTFNWELKGLKKSNTNVLSDVIIGTQWKVTATDEDGNVGSFDGATPFEPSAVSVDSFEEYSSLTEAQVLSWVKNVVSGSSHTNYWKHIMERIDAQINEKKFNEIRVESTDFPWAPTSGSAPIAPLVEV
jgi:hypothetical protein